MPTPFIDVNRTTKTIDAINQYKFKDNGSTIFSEIDPQQEIPLPDVWIPFNNSLIMKEGYGDELQADGITYAHRVSFTRASQATYIDKSGVLRTAGVDEPRFEKEGLLIEGRSTNLITQSEGWSGGSGSTGDNAWVHTEPDNQGWRTVTGGTDGGRPEGAYKDFATNEVLWGTTSTFSLDIKKVSGFKVMVRSYNASNADGFGNQSCSIVDGQSLPTGSSFKVTDMGDWLRVTMTRTFGDSGTSIFRMYPFGSNAGDSGSLTYRRAQIEPLPFATSYIPTSGAAATRAADVCSIPMVGNSNINAKDVSIGVNWDVHGYADNSYQRLFQIGGNSPTNNNVRAFVRPGNVQMHLVGANPQSVVPTGSTGVTSGVYAVKISGDEVTAFHNSNNTQKITVKDWVVTNTQSTIGIGGDGTSTYVRILFGHIRNFRIWHKALPDYLLKALTKV